ncbi:autotransporter outer membrane beta-barrel domain-containing protein [Parachitinimonas caeni]|uniref:Autotransporter domain-containing protein n=1 Tax=Parachitinimonas caeni TaxID=3031301 RepID=A0ABT7DYF0_9NEIS|nr:autotransporter domain-containing protein [Parachitinimonas caeni]MDK2123687.1 autotransporter domain-containing protein [Parachitinimonas caeni]
MIRHTKKLLGLAVVAALSQSAFAVQYSNTVFFGDSLTDTGAFGGLGPLPAGARWTVNDADIYASLIAKKYGVTLTPTNKDNPKLGAGNNYAQGGARAVEVTNSQPFGNIRDLPTQVTDHLTAKAGVLDPNALYTVFIGGNDIPAALTESATKGSAVGQAMITEAAASTVKQVGILKAKGAKYVAVVNLPDLSQTPSVLLSTIGAISQQLAAKNPAFAASAATVNAKAVDTARSLLNAGKTADEALAGAQAVFVGALMQGGVPKDTAAALLPVSTFTSTYATIKGGTAQLTSLYNTVLNAGLTQVGDVIQINSTALLNEVIANPKAFGIDNTSGMACGLSSGFSSLVCNDTQPDFDKSKTYLFADDRHPTPATHAVLAQYMASVLDAPMFASQLPSIQAITPAMQRQALDARLDEPHKAGEIGVFANYGYTSNDQKETVDSYKSDGRNRGVTVGVDYQLNDKITTGLAMTYIYGTTDFSMGRGRFEARDYLLTFFGGFRMGDLSINGDMGFGSTRYNQIERNVVLGNLNRIEMGDTSGSQITMRVNGGYDLHFGNITTGPTLGFAWRKSKVGAYAERNNAAGVPNSTTMKFDEQEIDAMLWSAGWKVAADFEQVKPFASVMFYHDSKDSDRKLRAGLVSQSSYFETPVYTPDNSYATLSLGTNFALGKSWGGYVQYTHTTGLSDERRRNYSIGLRGTF